MALLTLLIGIVLHVTGIYSSITQVPALGRHSDLLHFYNSRNDQFYPVLGLVGHLPPRSTLPQIKGNVECTSNMVKSLDDRLNSLGLSLKSKIDLLTGVVGMSGSTLYVKETKYNSDSIYGVVHYKRYTMYESFNARLPEIQSMVSLYPAKILGATDVVLGIMWGVDLIISFEFRDLRNSISSTTEIDFEASLNKLAYSIEVGAKADSSNSSQQSLTETQIKIYGDLVFPTIPRTLQEVEKLLRSIPEMLQANSSKGSPQFFDVIQVDKLESIIHYDVLSRELKNSKPIPDSERNSDMVALESELLLVFEEAESTMTEVRMWVSRIQGIENIFEASFVQKLNKYYLKYKGTYDIYISKFKNTIRMCRTVEHSRYKKKFNVVKTKYLKHRFGPRSFQKLLHNFLGLQKEKYFDYEAFKISGVMFANRYTSVNRLRLQHTNETIRFLFYTPMLKNRMSLDWNRLSNWFAVQTGIRYIVDCSLKVHAEDSCYGVEKIQIETYGDFDAVTKMPLLLSRLQNKKK